MEKEARGRRRSSHPTLDNHYVIEGPGYLGGLYRIASDPSGTLAIGYTGKSAESHGLILPLRLVA